MKKLLVAGAVSVSLSLGLSGCLSSIALQETKVTRSYTDYQQKEQDSIVGFVIHQETNQLIMLGNKYVYVFNNCKSKGCTSDKLKQILQNPQFLQLKNMSWTTQLPSRDKYNAILLNADNTFEFNVVFSFTPQNEQEFNFYKQIKFLLQDEATSGIGRQYYETLRLGGQMYEHNDSTRQLLKNAKPLSKSYTFGLFTQTTKTGVHQGNLVKRALILPFAVVGDILLLPLNIAFLVNPPDFKI